MPYFLKRDHFKAIGKLIAMSIVQGGSGIPALHPSVYNYIATGQYIGQVVNDKEVADAEVRILLEQVRLYTCLRVTKLCMYFYL